MRAISVATKGRIQSAALEVGTWGRISAGLFIELIAYACDNLTGHLERTVTVTGHTEYCEER